MSTIHTKRIGPIGGYGRPRNDVELMIREKKAERRETGGDDNKSRVGEVVGVVGGREIRAPRVARGGAVELPRTYAPQEHRERVKKIQARVREWIDLGKQTKMCTARPGWMTVSPRHAQYKKVMFTVEVDLTDILELDEDNKILRVEPSVNILQILDYLLPRGYTLPVLPELDELTVGGLVNGYGIESSSHKYGLFNDICSGFELVLPNAQLVNLGPEDPIFHTVPWSFGTVGFLTAIDLQVIPAQPYVRLKYIPVYSMRECAELWTHEQTKQVPVEFIEGMMYGPNEGVVMLGDFAEAPGPNEQVVHLNTWYKPYFYKHAKEFIDRRQEGTEVIPLRQYYQRHNRSIFWSLEDQIPVCHHWLFRLLLGWILPPRVAFLKLIESDSVTNFYEEKYVMQDFLVPLNCMLETMEICEKEIAVYPLWLCPHIMFNTGRYQGKIRAPQGTEKEGEYAHYVDVAAVGPPRVTHPFDMTKAMRTVEGYLRKVGGYQGNYSYTYQTREEYRQMFDHTLYDEVRKTTGAAEAFPESYDKVARKNQWKKQAGTR
ncbi:hypothetical protein CBR_g45591 [Chara braunii]|uniref:Delta(24)-sterol reductase n=1 Tax=Chara braunii TaxID=69332 RepID=A0A388LZ52_CHABU|nr:hypothetical protein CBR_g45591 [Chara braunii]|eukprot:GBG87533.1 hypothetical protein CBR_g45591 [Chara braunii]